MTQEQVSCNMWKNPALFLQCGFLSISVRNILSFKAPELPVDFQLDSVRRELGRPHEALGEPLVPQHGYG